MHTLPSVRNLCKMRMSASFGGGIGRMRETCGAACGMFLPAGPERSAADGTGRVGKSANQASVQESAAGFKAENGALGCAGLLGLAKMLRLSPIIIRGWNLAVCLTVVSSSDKSILNRG